MISLARSTGMLHIPFELQGRPEGKDGQILMFVETPRFFLVVDCVV